MIVLAFAVIQVLGSTYFLHLDRSKGSART